MHCRIVWRLPVNDILALIGMQTLAYIAYSGKFFAGQNFHGFCGLPNISENKICK